MRGGRRMSDDIKIEPMGWGWCPKCKCNMDKYNPSQLVITKTNKETNIFYTKIKKLLRIQCSVCDYILFENTIDVRDYQ